ncbi:hypothetical protein ACPOL_0008 [Acidisarcina polymorpha]|uniref:DUF3011 domain-containing protein n=2 Tax=Acidisarcina polymorpha TaxID=2211140 RepID=A0A2Z5FSF0_9BACT|nr:hypothetical protein ACPOL_0008 [Acidisarcina polymorpha]
MVRQRSGSACTQGYSWGYDQGGIWVDHGCRADFALGGGSAAPPAQAQMQPNDAMRLCKNTASGRLPGVPLAFISTYRGTDADSNTYMINFHAQPPGGQSSSGFCIISKNGRLQNFQFDPRSNNNAGASNSGGQTPQDAMRSCKNAVSARLPNVPLAFIQVDQPRVNGGSLLVNFRASPPNGQAASGSCDVFKNGRVNLQFR